MKFVSIGLVPLMLNVQRTSTSKRWDQNTVQQKALRPSANGLYSIHKWLPWFPTCRGFVRLLQFYRGELWTLELHVKAPLSELNTICSAVDLSHIQFTYSAFLHNFSLGWGRGLGVGGLVISWEVWHYTDHIFLTLFPSFIVFIIHIVRVHFPLPILFLWEMLVRIANEVHYFWYSFCPIFIIISSTDAFPLYHTSWSFSVN